MRHRIKMALTLPLLAVFVGAADGDGCSEKHTATAAETEQDVQNRQMNQFLRNQPVPSFDWSKERAALIALYIARQNGVNTFSYVQSEYTGKVLWSCASQGYPLPYATQLTNPNQVEWRGYNDHTLASAVIGQQEPNGLFPPGQSDATWVMCVDDKGKLTPVYEEKHVTVFLRPMQEANGVLTPVANATATMTIDTNQKP